MQSFVRSPFEHIFGERRRVSAIEQTVPPANAQIDPLFIGGALALARPAGRFDKAAFTRDFFTNSFFAVSRMYSYAESNPFDICFENLRDYFVSDSLGLVTAGAGQAPAARGAEAGRRSGCADDPNRPDHSA
jgi:hypothetical protein